MVESKIKVELKEMKIFNIENKIFKFLNNGNLIISF